jgi:alpha-glucosidase
MSFNFAPLFAPWDSEAWRGQITAIAKAFDPRDAWPTWVLSNHDQPRQRTRYGSPARARAAAVLLLSLRGTAFLYMGEELGLEDAVIPENRVVDPGGRDGCRAPVPWNSEPGHGWGEAPWLPFPPDSPTSNTAVQREDPDSVLHLYRRLLAARKASPALQLGDLSLLPAPDGVLAWQREFEGDLRIVVVNFKEEAVGFPIAGDFETQIASDGKGENERYTGRLEADQALVLKPAKQ